MSNKTKYIIGCCCIAIAALVALTVLFVGISSGTNDSNIASEDLYDGVSIGMTTANLKALIPSDRLFQYGPYSYYITEQGSYVVARHDSETNEITELHHIPNSSLTATPTAASMVSEGMGIYDVVALLGVPYRTATFGMITTVFKLSNGSDFIVYWRSDDDMTVISCYIQET